MEPDTGKHTQPQGEERVPSRCQDRGLAPAPPVGPPGAGGPADTSVSAFQPPGLRGSRVCCRALRSCSRLGVLPSQRFPNTLKSRLQGTSMNSSPRSSKHLRFATPVSLFLFCWIFFKKTESCAPPFLWPELGGVAVQGHSQGTGKGPQA